MQATALIDTTTDEGLVLETLSIHSNATLPEISKIAELEPPRTYEIVSRLRGRDLLSVTEEDGARRYSITDAGREAIGIDLVPDVSIEDEQAAKDEESAERGHGRALKVVEPLADFPHAMNEEEQRKLVLQAIGEKYGTLDGIKKRVGFPAWFDATELLAGMCVDYKIRKEHKGDLTAYFLYADKPLRFWRIGDGRIDFEKDPNFTVRNEAAKAEELSNRSQILYPEKKSAGRSLAEIDADLDADDFDPDADEDLAPIGKPQSPFVEKIPAQNGASAERKKNAKKRAGRYAYREISAEELESAAAKSAKMSDICESLKLSQSALYKKLDEDPDLKAAYKRGIAMRTGGGPDAAPGKKNGRPMKGENRPAKQPERPANGKGPDLDIDEVERLASEGNTAKEAAEFFGIELYQFKNRLIGKSPATKPIREAWYRGKKSAGISNRSRPAAKAVKETVKAPIKRTYKKRDKPADTETVVETVKAEEPAINQDKPTDKQDVVIHKALNADLAASNSFYEVAENFSFNVGNALLHIQMDELDAAIFYLERERSRRERVGA